MMIHIYLDLRFYKTCCAPPLLRTDGPLKGITYITLSFCTFEKIIINILCVC